MKNINDISNAMMIAMIVVAIYVPLKNVMTPNTKKIHDINPHANPSNPSVILIAFTIVMVEKNVMIGKNIHKCTFPAIGRKLI